MSFPFLFHVISIRDLDFIVRHFSSLDLINIFFSSRCLCVAEREMTLLGLCLPYKYTWFSDLTCFVGLVVRIALHSNMIMTADESNRAFCFNCKVQLIHCSQNASQWTQWNFKQFIWHKCTWKIALMNYEINIKWRHKCDWVFHFFIIRRKCGTDKTKRNEMN